MAEQPKRLVERRPSREQLAGGVLAGQAEAVEDVGDRMLKTAPRVGRFVAKRIPGLPGLVFDAANYASERDKGPAKTELLFQLAGGAIGAAGGPLGVAAGSVVGEMAGEYLYDHKDDISAWMKAREAEVARAAYAPIDRVYRAYRR